MLLSVAETKLFVQQPFHFPVTHSKTAFSRCSQVLVLVSDEGRSQILNHQVVDSSLEINGNSVGEKLTCYLLGY